MGNPKLDEIDPDRLDELVDPTSMIGSSVEIQFTYHGYDVTVTGEGVVHIEDE